MLRLVSLRAVLVWACAATGMLAPSRIAGAETTTTRLSLPQALALSQARAPMLVMARHAVREAEARRVGAGLIFPANPRLSIDVRPPITYFGTNHDPGYGVMLDFPVDLGGAPSARVHEAQRYADLAGAELKIERLRARYDTWTAYVRAAIDTERVVALEQLTDIGERVLSASRQRSERGAGNDIDEALAEGQVVQLRVQIEEARRTRDAHMMALRDGLDLAASEALTLTTTLVDPPPPPDANGLLARALVSRPEVAGLRGRMAVLDASDRRMAREVFPRMGLYVGVDAAPASALFAMVGLSVELPLAQRNQGARARVAAARAGEDDRLALQLRRIEREVVAAHASFTSRLVQLRALTDSALPAAQRALDLTETGWRSGRFDVFRVTAAARDVGKVRGMRLDALEAAWLDRIELDRAIGGLDS